MPPRTRKPVDSPQETVSEAVPERPQGTVDTPPVQEERVTVEEMTSDETTEAERNWEQVKQVIAEDQAGVVQRRLSALAVPQPGRIFAAIWAIMKDVRGVGKHGTMDPKAGGYQFRRYDDLKRAVSEACRQHGVMLQSRIFNVVNEQRGAMQRVQVHITYRFTSLEDASEVTFDAIGESIDRSDKASGKAMTMALKSALDQALMLAAEDIEDPDATRPEPDPYGNGTMVPSDRWGANQRGPLANTPERVMREASQREPSDGPGYPNDAPKDKADPWDKGPVQDERTPQEKAQAAADKLSASTITLDRWTAISQAARSMELLDIPVRTPDGNELPLKHYMAAVGRTL